MKRFEVNPKSWELNIYEKIVVQTWSFFKKDSVSFWKLLCEPLLNNLIPTSSSHEWLLVLYLGLLPIHQLMSQQKQHFSLAFLLNISFFFEGEILVNGCLVFLQKSVEKITFQKVPSHDTDVRKLWEIVGQMGAILEKSQTGIMRVRSWGYGISRRVIQETVYQNSRGSLKKE